MIISHKHKFIFVHIPKTGGTSITKALLPFLGTDDLVYGFGREENLKHIWASQAITRHPETLGYFKFSLTRNPWDRLVSNFHWWQQTTKHGWDLTLYNQYVKGKTFDEYIRGETWMVSSNCYDFIYNDGKSWCDYVGKFETINEDFANICQSIGIEAELDHHNKSDHLPYQSYYSGATVDLVAAKFKLDIDTFNYKFQ